jgi:hypothetical protein
MQSKLTAKDIQYVCDCALDVIRSKLSLRGDAEKVVRQFISPAVWLAFNEVNHWK